MFLNKSQCDHRGSLPLLTRMSAGHRNLHLSRKILVHSLELRKLLATPHLVLIEPVDTVPVGREAGKPYGFGGKAFRNTPTSALYHRDLGDAEPVTLMDHRVTLLRTLVQLICIELGNLAVL